MGRSNKSGCEMCAKLEKVESMGRKQVVIVTNSSNYEPRVERIAAYLRREDHDVTVIESDFSHREKKRIKRELNGYIYLNTIPYYKNLSVRRLYSHYNFSIKFFREIQKRQIDLLYVLVPANSLVKFAALYKKAHPSVKVVFDIIDLWPESLPLKKAENLCPVQIWRNLRDNYLGAADLVITECELYQKILQKSLENLEVRTLYWPKNEIVKVELPKLVGKEELHLCYIGSINNIIDISYTIEILKQIKLRKKVTIHIIGDGEKREELLEGLQKVGVVIQYYGAVYDERMKNDIMGICHYGLNIMKTDVCVGLTMKSVEYLAAGLPLINNIHGDTWSFVEIEDVGINCMPDIVDEAIERIVCRQSDMERRLRARALYENLFSPGAFDEKIEKYMKPLIDNFE